MHKKDSFKHCKSTKSICSYLIYELVGTALLTYFFNYGFSGGFFLVLFILSFYCWELSCAHFNPGITLSSFIFDYDRIDKNYCK